MNGIGRRRRTRDNDDIVTVALKLGAMAPDSPSAQRLAEMERIHADEIASHRQLASDHAALLDALHARSPEEWHIGDPATAALAYLRHLEDEADRCGINRRPPWSREDRPRDEHLFRRLAAELGAEERFGLPVPPRTAADAQDPGSAAVPADGGPADRPAAADPAIPGPEVQPPAGEDAAPTAAGASPRASGPVSSEDEPVQDEPDAEADCGETGDVA
jgi:hypothetical protein